MKVALGWHAIELAKTSAILEFYISSSGGSGGGGSGSSSGSSSSKKGLYTP